MSKMLEQAIIDAEALREAALKNAEQNIIEKYSAEVKEAVNQILEQPEDEMTVGMEMDPTGAEGEVVDDPLANIPRADTDGDDLCPCPDEGKDITIDLIAIAQELERDQEGDKVPREDVVDDEVTLEPEEEEEEEIELRESDDLDFEIPDEFIDDLMERMSLNVQPVPSGVPGGGSNITMERELEDIVKARLSVEELNDKAAERETEEADAEMASSEKELVQIDSTAMLELDEQIKELTDQRSQLVEENNELKSLLLKVKVKLEEVNLTNAQLHYTNKVLGSTSLNERQKINIVESLSNTSTVEETKVIYDTLQGAVGSESKSTPQSLSEAIGRPSAVIPRKEEKSVKDPVSNRWKTLAGIDKKR